MRPLFSVNKISNLLQKSWLEKFRKCFCFCNFDFGNGNETFLVFILSFETRYFFSTIVSRQNFGKPRTFKATWVCLSNYFIEFVHYGWVNQLTLFEAISDNNTQMIIFHRIIFSNFLSLHDFVILKSFVFAN
jgi:hypothetical protein